MSNDLRHEADRLQEEYRDLRREVTHPTPPEFYALIGNMKLIVDDHISIVEAGLSTIAKHQKDGTLRSDDSEANRASHVADATRLLDEAAVLLVRARHALNAGQSGVAHLYSVGK
jgi:hypothetical protein